MTAEDHDHAQLQSTLNDILTEARRTNGRVKRLERASEQHHRVLFGSAEEKFPGLVAAVQRNAAVVETVEVFIVWTRRAVIALVTAAAGLGANLALNLIN